MALNPAQSPLPPVQTLHVTPHIHRNHKTSPPDPPAPRFPIARNVSPAGKKSPRQRILSIASARFSICRRRKRSYEGKMLRGNPMLLERRCARSGTVKPDGCAMVSSDYGGCRDLRATSVREEEGAGNEEGGGGRSLSRGFTATFPLLQRIPHIFTAIAPGNTYLCLRQLIIRCSGIGRKE